MRLGLLRQEYCYRLGVLAQVLLLVYLTLLNTKSKEKTFDSHIIPLSLSPITSCFNFPANLIALLPTS